MLIVLLEYIDLFSLTCNLIGKDFQNNYTYYASIMLDFFRYLLCCRHNRLGPTIGWAHTCKS